MEGYCGSAIPPLSYCSRFRRNSIVEGSSSSKKRHEDKANDEQKTSLHLRERKRRDKMNENFSVLQSMVPTVSKYSKLPKENILNGAVNYIKYLEEEVKWLEGLKEQKQIEQKVTMPVFPRATNHNSAKITVLNEAVFVAIQVPSRHGLVLEIAKVLEKHDANVVEARVSVDDQRLLTFTATIMPGGNGDGTFDKIKKDLLAL